MRAGRSITPFVIASVGLDRRPATHERRIAVKTLLASALAGAVLLTACGGDDDNGPTDPGNGSSGYTATITGLEGLSESSGDAFWTEGTDTETNTTSFVIGLRP